MLLSRGLGKAGNPPCSKPYSRTKSMSPLMIVRNKRSICLADDLPGFSRFSRYFASIPEIIREFPHPGRTMLAFQKKLSVEVFGNLKETVIVVEKAGLVAIGKDLLQGLPTARKTTPDIFQECRVRRASPGFRSWKDIPRDCPGQHKRDEYNNPFLWPPQQSFPADVR